MEGIPVFVNNHGDVRIAARYRAGYETYFQSDSDSRNDSNEDSDPRSKYYEYRRSGFLTATRPDGKDLHFWVAANWSGRAAPDTLFRLTNSETGKRAYLYDPWADRLSPILTQYHNTTKQEEAELRENWPFVKKAMNNNLDAFLVVRFYGDFVEDQENMPKIIGEENLSIGGREFDIYETVPDGWSVVEGASVREGYALVSNNEPFYSGKIKTTGVAGGLLGPVRAYYRQP